VHLPGRLVLALKPKRLREVVHARQHRQMFGPTYTLKIADLNFGTPALLCVPHANAMETPALGKPVLTLF
jgi:hypothetical protein